MAKRFEARITTDCGVATLRTRLLDPERLARAARAAGAEDVVVEAHGETTTITRRFVVPEAARLIAKTDQIHLVEVRTWRGDTADVHVSAREFDVSVEGQLTLGQQEDTCVVLAAGEVSANMGFAGQFVESYIRDHLAQALEVELAELGAPDL